MLAEWASAKSSTSIDDKIVSEIRKKLEADGNYDVDVLFNAEPFSSLQGCSWLR